MDLNLDNKVAFQWQKCNSYWFHNGLALNWWICGLLCGKILNKHQLQHQHWYCVIEGRERERGGPILRFYCKINVMEQERKREVQSPFALFLLNTCAPIVHLHTHTHTALSSMSAPDLDKWAPAEWRGGVKRWRWGEKERERDGWRVSRNYFIMRDEALNVHSLY